MKIEIAQFRLNIFSERELLKQQLIQAQKMEAIGVLSSGIAHEFNNILFSIMANAELCFSELNDHDPRNEYIEAILNGGNRAKELISNILSFNKKNKYNRYPILLKPVISETLKLLTPSIPSNINIVINMYEEEDYVFIGKTEVYEIIMNLCLNSFQSMEKKSGTVKIGLDRVYPSPHVNLPFKEFCRIKIEDNGIGIQPDILQMIFKPFFTTKKDKGTGLGLSVVQEIVDKAKGAIDLQSRIGIGTTMNVLLPITNIK